MVDSRPEKQKMMLHDQGQMRFQFQHTPMLMTFQKSDTESLTTFLTGEQSPPHSKRGLINFWAGGSASVFCATDPDPAPRAFAMPLAVRASSRSADLIA